MDAPSLLSLYSEDEEDDDSNEDTDGSTTNEDQFEEDQCEASLRTRAVLRSKRNLECRCQELLNVERMLEAMESSSIREKMDSAKDFLNSDSSAPFTENEYRKAMWYIVYKILVNHGHRTCMIMNARKDDFYAGLRDCKTSGDTTFFVGGHKSDQDYAPLGITVDLQQMNSFLFRREIIIPKESPWLFTLTGEKLKAKCICKGLCEFTGISFATPTLIRRAVVSKTLNLLFKD